MTALGEYADDDTSSTLKHCDHKEAKDLVVPDVAPTVTSKRAKVSGGPAGSETGNMVLDNPIPAWGMYGPSGQEGATEEEQPTITGSHGQPGNVAVPAVLMTMREGKPGGGKGPLLTAEESLTLATGNGQTLFQPKAFRKSARVRSAITPETWVDDGLANTINTFDVGDVRTTHAIVEPQSFDEMNFTTDGDTHHVLRAGTKQSTGAITQYGVRRLTPVECERLQSFPDGWTEPSGSDSARYKAMGNAVTVNVVRWILSRLP